MASKVKAKDVVKGVFSTYMPVTVNTVDNAKEAANDVRTIGKQIHLGMRQNLKNIDKSQPGRKAIALFSAAKDALRDGNYELEQTNDEMYEDFESYEDNFTTSSMTDEERANSSPEEIMLRGNKGVAQTVIRASTAQLQGMGTISERMLKTTLKGMEASTKSINATILYGTNMLATQMGIANNKLDTINENLVSLINYQNENTTMYYEKTLELMNGMIASMNNLNTMNQGKGARDLKNFSTRGGFNIKEYLSRVKKGIKNSTLVSGAGMLQSMYQMSNDNPDIMSPGQLYGSFIPMIASMTPGLNKLHNKASKFTKLDTRFSQYMDELLYKINDTIESSKYTLELSTLGLDSLGNKRRRIGGINTGAYMKDQLPWNGKAQKALTEVIPELLTSIDAGINKTDKRYFDYDEGNWKGREELTKQFFDQINNSITLEASTITSRVDKYFNMNGLSDQIKEALHNEISNAAMDIIHDQGDLTENRQKISDALIQGGLTDHEYAQVFNDLMKSFESTKEQVADLYAKIGSTNSVYGNINNRSGATADKGIGKNAYVTAREQRYNNNLFGMSFSQDVESTLQYIETQMKEIDPEFKMTKETREGIIVAIRQGHGNEEILRMVKRTIGKGNIQDKVFEYAGRAWAKIRGKEYTPKMKSDEEDETEDYGQRVNAMNLKAMEKVYGIKVNKPKTGAASSARSKMDGKTAGAGTTGSGGSPSDGKSFDLGTEETVVDKLKDQLIADGTPDFDDVLDSNEGDLQKRERNVAATADAINEAAKNGSTTLGGSIKMLIDASVTSMGAMISSFSTFGARLFGKQGMISKFFESKTFKSGLEKIKNAILYDKEGKLRPGFQKAKDFGASVWAGTKEKLNHVYDYAYDSYAKYKYGEDYENNENWQNSSFMQTMNLKAKRGKKSEENVTEDDEVKSSTPEIEGIDETLKESVQKVSEDTPAVLKESVEKIGEAGTKSAQMIEDSTKAMTEALIGDPDEKPEDTKKKYAKPFADIAKKHLPKIGAGAVLGAGIGMLNGFGGHSLLGSLFLPTGLLGGAIVGGGLTLLSQTEAFKSIMFGKKGEDGERTGGLISKKLKESFKKAAPIAVGGAVAGALKSIITAPLTGGIASGNGLGVLGVQLLPGGILGGAIMGMGIGLLKNSETFKSALFGKKDEDGKRTGTFLSKSFESMKQKMSGSHEGLKKMLKGGALGVVSGTVLANMGALPAALSVGGPVGMGIMGLGMGIAASTEKFDSWLFGTEEFDNDGKSLGRKGGVLGRVKNLININVVEPISTTFKSAMLDMIDWTKEKITLPFRTAFGPMIDSIRGIKDNVVELVSDKFKAVGDSITDMMKKTISTLFSPITKLIGGIGKALLGGAKVGAKVATMPLTMGLSAMNMLTSKKRRKEYGKFYKAYYTEGGMMTELNRYWKAKQDDYDEEAADYNAEADKTGKAHKRAKTVGIFEKASDFLSAMTGNGEIADAARSGWNETAGAFGQNTFNWRNAFREKKELKANRKERHKAEKQWAKISKLSREIGNKDLHGREVTLTDSMFEKYKDKFVKAGIDPSLIKTNDDLMKLIYDPRGFRNQAAGDSGRDGMLQALKAFRLTPEEIEDRKRTEEYRDNVTKVLEEIKNHFIALGEDEFFDRSKTSYETDRRKELKILKRKHKRVSKNSLWDGRNAINFSDPELNEYDLKGITEDDLNDYAASKYADNDDFKGWLASKGRKMSPDDYRREFFDPERLKKRQEGKSSLLGLPPHKDEESTQTADGKSSESPADEIADAIKEQTNIIKTEAELNAGGSANFKKLSNKAKRGALNEKTAKANGISGFFGNIFKRKKKDELLNAQITKEAEESAEAQALGDKTDESNEESKDVNVNVTTESTEKKQGILSKIFGAFDWFGGTKVGKVIKGGIKLFSGIGLLGGIGLTIAELIKPGTADSIGASITQWNNEMQESAKNGTIVDNITSKITAWFDNIGNWIDEKVLSENGYLMKGANAVAETMPKVLDKIVIPSIERTTEFITKNGETLVGAAATVVEAIAPPLATALVDTVPDIIDAIAEALWNRLTGKSAKVKGDTRMTNEEVELAKANGKYVGTKEEIITEEEAKKAEAQGLTVYKNADGTYTLVNNYTLDSNMYLDKDGNVQTTGNESQINRLKSIGGNIVRLGVSGNMKAATKLAGTAVKAGTATMGGMMGATVSPFTGVGGVIGGTKAGNKIGGLFKSGLEKIGGLFGKTGAKAATEATEKAAVELVTESGQKLVQNSAGKWVDAETKKFVSKATVDAAKNAAETATKKSGSIFSKIGNFFTKGGAKAATEAADDVVLETAEALGKAAKNSAGTGIETVAEKALKENQSFIQKCIDALKGLTSDKTVEKAIKEGTEEVSETVAKKGISKVINDVCEKLGKAMIEVANKSKLGQKIISIIADKGAMASAKAAAAVGTAGLVEIASITFGAIGGFADTGKVANLFEVSTSLVNFKMRLISSILQAFFASTLGSYVEIGLIIVELITGYDVAKWMASSLYDLFSGKKGEEKLDKAQEALAVETALYNQKHGTNMTVSEYNDAANKSFASKTWNNIKGFFGGKNKNIDNKGLADEAASIVKSGNYSIDSKGNAILTNVGNGKGAVGFGPGQSQGNGAWANMPIGRFANGKVSTMKTGGCGPTALSTIANMYGPGINPGTVGAYAASNGYITAGGANADLFTKGAAGLGLHGVKVGKNDISSALATGHPMAISGKNSGPFTKNGHVVVANGISNNKIRIIDPMDGKTKVYDKNSITSGMTNAWAYEKPVGYGIISNLGRKITDKALSGLSDATKLAMINTLGTVQTALANVPIIMASTMESLFKPMASAIATPISVPIKYAVDALGTLSKIIGNEEMTSQELQNTTNTSTMLNNMSSSIKSSMRSVKVNTKSISSSKLKSNVKTTTGKESIFTKVWNKLSGKSKKNTGYGRGAVGYGIDNNLFPTIPTLGIGNNTLANKVNEINNNMSGPVSYEGIYDANYKYAKSLGLSDEQAAEVSNAKAAEVWKNGTGKDVPSYTTNSNGSSTQGIRYETPDGTPADPINTTTTTSTDTTSTESNEPSMWDKAKSALSKVPSTLGELVTGFTSLTSVFDALWGSLMGNGSFKDLLNGTNSSDNSGVIFNNSGNYETYSNGEEQKRVWKYFKDKGFTDNAIAGIMGAWNAESGVKALRVEGDYLSKAKAIGIDKILESNTTLDDYVTNVLFPAYDNTPSLKGKIKKSAYLYNSHYYPGLGIAQWTGQRAYNLGQYAKSKNSDWRSLNTQLDFTNEEIDKRGLQVELNNAKSPEDAAYIFAKKFEVGGYSGDGLTKRQNAAKTWYNTLANEDLTGYGRGPVGFGPDEENNWSTFMSGASNAFDYLQSKINDMGLGDYFNITGSLDSIFGNSNANNVDIAYDSSLWGEGNSRPVDAMKSILGKLNYSLDGDKQNPDNGSASCASTVAWAYNKALGVRPGDSVSSTAYMSSTAQANDNRFSTIWTNNGTGLTDDVISTLMPGDIFYQNWDRTRNNGKMKHTEMYVGNGQTLSHGGPNWSDKGPVYKTLNDYRKKHTMMIRRYNGFLKDTDGVSYGNGPDNDTLKLENNFSKEMRDAIYKDDRKPKDRPNPRGEAEGYGPDNSDVIDRLDKIVTVIGEWYMMSKKNQNGPSTTTNTVVNNTAVTNQQPNQVKETKTVSTHIDKLAQKHQTYAKMYRSTL